MRIKHMLLIEGLTIEGARRKLEQESTPVGASAAVIDELIGENARERLTEVKRGLRSILDMLAGRRGAQEFELAPPPLVAPRPRAARAARPSRAKPPRGKVSTARRRT